MKAEENELSTYESGYKVSLVLKALSSTPKTYNVFNYNSWVFEFCLLNVGETLVKLIVAENLLFRI